MKKILFTLLAAIALAAPASLAFDLKDLIQKAEAAKNQSNTNNTPATQAPSDTQTTDTQAPAQQGGQGLGDILGGLLGGGSSSGSSDSGLGAIGSILKGVISSSDVSVADMVGDWEYSSPAFAFQSDNLLQKAGGAAASAAINSKLEPYYKQAGIDKLKASFYPDSTFVLTLPRATLKGTITPAGEGNTGDFLFTFKAFGKISVGSMNAHVEKAGKKTLTITFDVSKLIKVVDTVAKVSGRSSLQAAAKLLNSYDGLNCGFELKQTSATPAQEQGTAANQSASTSEGKGKKK